MDLEAEYSDKAAARSRERAERERQKTIAAKRKIAEPIANPEQLSDAVAELAARWGLKRKSGG